jgi:hypothetical protein
MATVDEQVHHAGRGPRSGPGAGRHHGRDTQSLAEVIMIRRPGQHRAGLLGSLVTRARVFASSRFQATAVRSTPHPPSSPAPRATLTASPLTPNDAA